MDILAIKLALRTKAITVWTEGGVQGSEQNPPIEPNPGGITCQEETVTCQAETVTNDFE